MRNRILLAVELILLTTAVTLGVLWALNPAGTLEPFTLLATLGMVAVDIFRRKGRAPTKPDAGAEPSDSHPFTYRVGEEVVTYEEKLRSLTQDVIKVNAYTHPVGIGAERAWIQHHYPGSRIASQALTTLPLLTGARKYDSKQIHFDHLQVVLENGRKKAVFFDISSFFAGDKSSTIMPKETFAAKLAELYSGIKNGNTDPKM